MAKSSEDRFCNTRMPVMKTLSITHYAGKKVVKTGSAHTRMPVMKTTYSTVSTRKMMPTVKQLFALLIAGFLFSAGHKEGELLAKIETAVSLFKLGFLGSTEIPFYETGKNYAVRMVATRHS